MPNRLAGAVSPYLRAHADNPVDWWPWGPAPFAEARRRDVPVLISIGYATCHWCHVMARESFQDETVAAVLNGTLVAVKVDREEHPDVDAAYLAAAGAFTRNLGWPLTVFATSDGRAFFAGTYFPPAPRPGMPSFAQVVDAVLDAWRERREQVHSDAGELADALRRAGEVEGGALPTDAELGAAVTALAASEDTRYGGFGAGPKFPVVPVLRFLAERGLAGDAESSALAERTLRTIAASPLLDPVEGGFFRYAVQRDWSEPHYERMLSDNAQLLHLAARLGDETTTLRIAGFLLEVMRVPGGFASAQDSESDIDGVRTEGGYYALDAAGRARQPRPALDAKVLTGWNGLAVGALAAAGDAFARDDLVRQAVEVADELVATHLDGDRLVRATRDGIRSTAPATLEDAGLLADGLIDIALATGEARFAVLARRLVDAVLGPDGAFRAPGEPDAVLTAAGLSASADPGDGATPSGTAATASAARRLHLLTGVARYRDAAVRALAPLARNAVQTPIAFGGALTVLQALAEPIEQVVVVGNRRGALADVARRGGRGLSSIVTEPQARAFADAGFELYEGRTAVDGADTAYVCRDFVCRLPVQTGPALEVALAAD